MSKVISLTQASELISAIGHKRTVLVVGPMGSGKSSIVHTLHERFPGHAKRVLDVATMMDGELATPCPDQETRVMSWLVNELFVGDTQDQPILLLVDEMGKAQGGVLNTIMTLLLERRVGMRFFPEGSIIFASTNESDEGLGDFIQPHQRNRIITVHTRAYTTPEWNAWALTAGINPMVCHWLEQVFPERLPDFNDNDAPDATWMTFHPKMNQDAFLTHRSLHAASDILWARDQFDRDVLLAALEGAVGVVAGGKLFAQLELHDKLPKMNDIVSKPDTTVVPDDPMLGSLLVFNMLHRVISTRNRKEFTRMTEDAKWIKTSDALLTYATRLEANLQHMFCIRMSLAEPGCAAVFDKLKAFGSENAPLLQQMYAK